jgi:hypothetical protein
MNNFIIIDVIIDYRLVGDNLFINFTRSTQQFYKEGIIISIYRGGNVKSLKGKCCYYPVLLSTLLNSDFLGSRRVNV